MEDHRVENDFVLGEALRAEPGTAASARLEAWLRGMDDAGWRALLQELRTLARKVAVRYPDVADADDTLGDLAVSTCDGWLPSYLEALSRGDAPASLWSYLEVRLRSHLEEQRRKRRRRAELLDAHVGPRPAALERDELPLAEALIVGNGTGTDPHEAAFADEVMRKAGRDPNLRAILALRYAGFTQQEIANLLSISRPTVSRRLALLASVVGALIVAALLAAAVLLGFLRADAGRPEIRQDRSLAPQPVPAGGSAPAAGLSAAQIGEVVRAHREHVETCWTGLGDARSAAVTAEIDISPAGWTRSVEVAGDGGPGLHRCIDRIVRMWSFPSADDPTRTVVPFLFAAAPSDDEVSAEESDATLDAQARHCAMIGDNPCIVRTLEGRARTESQLAQLIEAYRARGQTREAARHMRTFVQRFPGTPRARNYEQILTRSH